jgi:four helix bundle protein
MTTHQYKKLKIWQESVSLSIEIYKVTKLFPDEEKFGLISQLRRASISIPSNIAEGSKRGTKKDFISFLRIALGSAAELETQIFIAYQLDFIHEKEYKELNSSLEKNIGMLDSFIKSINSLKS